MSMREGNGWYTLAGAAICCLLGGVFGWIGAALWLVGLMRVKAMGRYFQASGVAAIIFAVMYVLMPWVISRFPQAETIFVYWAMMLIYGLMVILLLVGIWQRYPNRRIKTLAVACCIGQMMELAIWASINLSIMAAFWVKIVQPFSLLLVGVLCAILWCCYRQDRLNEELA